MLKDLADDPLQDFIPIMPLTKQPDVLVVRKLSGLTNTSELIAAAKAKPGEILFRGVVGIESEFLNVISM